MHNIQTFMKEKRDSSLRIHENRIGDGKQKNQAQGNEQTHHFSLVPQKSFPKFKPTKLLVAFLSPSTNSDTQTRKKISQIFFEVPQELYPRKASSNSKKIIFLILFPTFPSKFRSTQIPKTPIERTQEPQSPKPPLFNLFWINFKSDIN